MLQKFAFKSKVNLELEHISFVADLAISNCIIYFIFLCCIVIYIVMNFKKIISHPLLGIAPGKFIKLLVANGFRHNFITFVRIFYILSSSLSVGILAAIESALYGRKLADTKIQTDPVFIIGHWRSGTTFLHYMMAEDKRFGYVSNQQVFMPRAMLVARKLTSTLTKLHMEEKRPMDDVALTPNSPQEEEYALLHYGIESYLGSIFPKRMKEYFLKHADLENCTTEEIEYFKKCYYQLVQKITFACGGKQLLLKNPVSTARIKTLLELFPNAKFIYLHRNPYEVYLSTIRLHEKVSELFALQQYNSKDIEGAVPELYKFMMAKYEQDKKLIPAGQLIEISYEELMRNPLATAEKIYSKLELPEFTVAKEAFVEFLKTQREYKPANYQITEETKKQLDDLLCLN